MSRMAFHPTRVFTLEVAGIAMVIVSIATVTYLLWFAR